MVSAEIARSRAAAHTGIQVPAEQADKAFMRALDFLVSHGFVYADSWREIAG